VLMLCLFLAHDEIRRTRNDTENVLLTKATKIKWFPLLRLTLWAGRRDANSHKYF
jgi:hypothetical protein